MKTMKSLISSRFLVEHSVYLQSTHPSSRIPFITEVKSKLIEGKYKLANHYCPCGSSGQDVLISEVDRYGLPLNSVLCWGCGTIRINPYLDEDSLENFYTHFYQDMYGRTLDLDSYFIGQKNYGEKVLSVAKSFLNPQSRVCEIGCGAGGALKVFQDRGYTIAGCDYSQVLIDAGRQRQVKNIYLGGSLSEVANHLGQVKFDLIYLHHVFEHLSDPLSFLQNCTTYLTSNGKVIIAIPDISTIDTSRFPAGDLLLYLHIAHKYNFSYEGLRRLCRRAGYTVSKLYPDPSIKTSCSDSSELWIQMSLETSPSALSDPTPYQDVGPQMLKYLKRTEKLYSLGLCRGQVIRKWEKVKPPSPRYVLGRIKHRVLSKL